MSFFIGYNRGADEVSTAIHGGAAAMNGLLRGGANIAVP
jgi:hypothetical protein